VDNTRLIKNVDDQMSVGSLDLVQDRLIATAARKDQELSLKVRGLLGVALVSTVTGCTCARASALLSGPNGLD